jgi:SagB-type dehydrogenase family enzyme
MSKITGVGDKFQEETRYHRERMPRHQLDWSKKPSPFKDYENPLSIIQLPDPKFNVVNIWETILKRRSRRNYNSKNPLDLKILSNLLWATQGTTENIGEVKLRTSPSAGGLYPIETYLNVRLVENLQTGVYHFRPQFFDLEFLKSGDHSRLLSQAALHQEMVESAQITFIWTAIVERSKWKYLQRAYRYIYLDAGHIAQNLYLSAEALDLGVCGIGAFIDDEVAELIEIDETKEIVLYLASVGRNT